jgi:hypothetical protein
VQYWAPEQVLFCMHCAKAVFVSGRDSLQSFSYFCHRV